jgi:hypothetical protein
MPGSGLGRREDPLPAQASHRLENFMVDINDRQIEGPAVPGDRQVDPIVVDNAPAQSEGLRSSKSGEE